MYLDLIILSIGDKGYQSRAVGSFFMGRGAEQKCPTPCMVGWRQKIEKKKHRLKRSKAVPKNEIWTKI